MSGIYLHIPFCKQACHYCDFHFSTSLKKKGSLVEALSKELVLRKEEVNEEVQSIYFGGGTPSLLTMTELQSLLDTIYEHYEISEYPEITLEANPDDLSQERVLELADSSINRLSIGVQSFFEKDLKLMNRAHNATEAVVAIELAKTHFENYSIDLIYGIPEMSPERWLQNLEKALSFDIPHLSCYALTVEPKTALNTFIQKGIISPVDDDMAHKHHQLLVAAAYKAGMDNYEFSNFGKPGFYSENNMGYWHGEPYLGVGPSAHSYDGKRRSWNVANNTKYIKALEANELPIERELLSTTDRYNEYVMTRLRTQWGILLDEIKDQFGSNYYNHLMHTAASHIRENRLEMSDGTLYVTPEGKFLSDGIASDLFYLLPG